MSSARAPALPDAAPDRLADIVQARRSTLYGEGRAMRTGTGTGAGMDPCVERSWLRCLAAMQEPDRAPSFDTIAVPALRRTLDEHRLLLQAARPVLERLGRAIAGTRYFSILTNQHGVVIDASGAIDRSDRRADLITRIGTDLSEQHLATTAIGAALAELQPVWLHQGEHFFESNAVYSCAGAPIFGPDGACVGMLDLTGIEATERPELKHLVAQSACSIENALALGTFHAQRGLVLRLNWPGPALGGETDALVCLDADGLVLGANQAARKMVPQLGAPPTSRLHCSELFAIAFETLFDAARAPANRSIPLEVPLWTGLRLYALPTAPGHSFAAPPNFTATAAPALAMPPALPLRDIETALIRKAVDDARGNVAQAAKALGVSRATVYRRLAPAHKRH